MEAQRGDSRLDGKKRGLSHDGGDFFPNWV